MRDLAAAAKQIDYWGRRYVFQYAHGTDQSERTLSPASDRRVWLLAIRQARPASGAGPFFRSASHLT
jgi:hypothetical protein